MRPQKQNQVVPTLDACRLNEARSENWKLSDCCVVFGARSAHSLNYLPCLGRLLRAGAHRGKTHTGQAHDINPHYGFLPISARSMEHPTRELQHCIVSKHCNQDTMPTFCSVVPCGKLQTFIAAKILHNCDKFRHLSHLLGYLPKANKRPTQTLMCYLCTIHSSSINLQSPFIVKSKHLKKTDLMTPILANGRIKEQWLF